MKKIISALLLVCMVISLIPAIIVPSSADTVKTELTLKWNSGYVGSNTHSSYKNTLSGTSDGWRYTDVFIVEKAGTKVSFDTVAASTNSVYVFSSWKQSGSSYVFDTDGTSLIGTNGYDSIGQSKNGSLYHYEFITDRDNQALRICIKYTDSLPAVYTEATSDKTTKAQLAENEFTATLAANGTVEGLKWFCGYASSATNTNGSKKETKPISAGYSYTNLFTVPKAGTKLTYTLSCSPNNAYNAFTRYKLEGTRYVYDTGFDATNELVKSGSGSYTFTYVTSVDNEVLRICCRPGAALSSFIMSAPVTVSWEATNEPGTISKMTDQKTEWPAPELISMVTGAPLIGKEITDLKWYHGYVGSSYHDSAPLAITSPNNVDYYYSDVFTVEKAGTTVYFFDQTFTDFDGSAYASTSVETLTHWKKQGTAWVIDKNKVHLNGCDVYNVLLTKDYRVYSYTTTEDNENIRLCMRYAPMYSTEDFGLIPPVYTVEKSDFDAEQPPVGTDVWDNRALFDGSYTDASGNKTEYKYYLPYGCGTPDGQYSLVFDNSSDSAVAKYLAENGVAASIVVAYNGDIATSLRLLDEVIAKYPVKVSDLLLIGGDELAAHAKRFENIRLCRALLYTGSAAAPTFDYAEVKSMSSFATADDAALWLVGEYGDYYDVLEGLNMYAMGDSYFGGSGLGQHQTWVNLLGYKYDMAFHNYGIGGNTVAICSGTGANQPPMCTRYKTMPTDGNIYFLEGGRNDRHYSVPFGNNTDTAGTTFKGAMNIMIRYIRQNNPDAMIVLVTPWSSKGESGYLGTNNDYADALQELADYYDDPHIVCLYAADVSFTGIDMSNASIRAKYCIKPDDYSHLNADGMYMVLPKFEKWIAEKYAVLKNLTVKNDADDNGTFQTIGPKPTDTEPTPTESLPTPTDSTPVPSESVTVPTETVPSESDNPTESETATAPTTDAPKKKSCGGISVILQFASIVCGIFGTALVVKKRK